jgi:DDE domain
MKADGSFSSDTKQRSSKYLNDLIEQDHRGVKQRIAAMPRLKQFRHAAITIAGIKLMHRIRKGQYGLRRLGVRGRAASAVWECSTRGIRVTRRVRDARARAAVLHQKGLIHLFAGRESAALSSPSRLRS